MTDPTRPDPTENENRKLTANMKQIKLQIQTPNANDDDGSITTDTTTSSRNPPQPTPTPKPTKPPIKTIRSNAREPLIEAEIEGDLEKLTIKQARFLVARLTFPLFGDAKCARLAGYADRTSGQQAHTISITKHVVRLLAHAAASNVQAETYGHKTIDRPAAMEILAGIAADQRESARLRMDALKQLRDLEAWDKPKGARGEDGEGDALSEILGMVDGQTACLPSRESGDGD